MFNPTIRRTYARTQRSQDNGVVWGVALDDGIRFYEQITEDGLA